jgi:surface antigen
MLALAAALSACATSNNLPGGVPPAQLAAAAEGSVTLTAGLIGNAIGVDLPEADKQAGLLAEYRALELGAAGTPVTWTGTVSRGEVIPGARYRVNEYECRDYTHTIVNSAGTEAARGTACREPNGNWSPVI